VEFFVIFMSLLTTIARAEDTCLAKAPSLKPVIAFQVDAKQASIDYYRNLCSELQKETATLKESDIDVRTSFEKFEAILKAQPKEWLGTFTKKIGDVKKIEALPVRIAAAYDLAAEAYGQFDLEASAKLWKQIHLDSRAQQRAVVLAMVLSKVKKASNEFGLQIVTFQPFKAPRTVVRVKIASRAGLVFDLDPARAGRSFEALPALHQAKVSSEECVTLFQCEVAHASP
jgi:hypothetical protein